MKISYFSICSLNLSDPFVLLLVSCTNNLYPETMNVFDDLFLLCCFSKFLPDPSHISTYLTPCLFSSSLKTNKQTKKIHIQTPKKHKNKSQSTQVKDQYGRFMLKQNKMRQKPAKTSLRLFCVSQLLLSLAQAWKYCQDHQVLTPWKKTDFPLPLSINCR